MGAAKLAEPPGYIWSPSMDLAVAHTLYRLLAGGAATFVYSGGFHDEHTARLVDLGEHLVQQTEGERSLRNKLGFVLVEAYQNIIRHRATLPAELTRTDGRSLLALRLRADTYEVVAMNPLLRAEEPVLGDLLGRLRNLSIEQLKALFLDALQHGGTSRRGGAGLGLIEMARRSGHGLWHRLEDIGSEHRLFTLRVMLGGESAISSPDELSALHRGVAAGDVRSLCVGMPSGVQAPVMGLVAKDAEGDADRADTCTRAYLAATELLDAVIAPGVPPMIVVAGAPEGLAFVLGGRMDVDRADGIEQQVERINAMSPSEVQRGYRDALIGRGDSRPCTTGLFDLARRMQRPMRLQRGAVTDGTVPLLLEVVV